MSGGHPKPEKGGHGGHKEGDKNILERIPLVGRAFSLLKKVAKSEDVRKFLETVSESVGVFTSLIIPGSGGGGGGKSDHGGGHGHH